MIKDRLRALDSRLFILVLVLTLIGTLTLFSAGRGTAQSGLWIKQTAWNLAGFAFMAYLGTTDPTRILRSSLLIYVAGILSLVAVLAVGHRIGGAQRWLVLGGQTFQPSELMKWATLLFVAHRLGVRQPDQVTRIELAGAVAIVLFPMLLVLKQPDLGMALSFTPILLLLPLMKGLRVRTILIILALLPIVGVVAWKKVLKPYQKQRIETFLDPSSDIQGKGYQINQSRIAIGSGGLVGKGFTAGSQTQLNYLPVKTTDFVFAVWAEERGFLGVLLALGLYGAFLMRLLQTAKEARSASELYFCVGAAGIFGMHLIVNVGMVAGALPNKGIALPFFSYGGSSTLSFFLALGVVMGVWRRAKAK
ncbi:MAG TPA: rod shape-determining protein RodA [Holophagaceae bacterium]|nr:rod shape-determining protein RodA [Holophagaceae bacterium]